MKQPHIYTMPESFLQDQSVPARWRVLGIINGFLLNDQKFWGSNEWLGKQIKAHKDTVSQAIKELEEQGFIVCRRTRRKRVVQKPGSEIGTNAYLRPTPTPISDRRQRLSISVSNSDSNSCEPSVAPIEVVSDSEIERKVPKGKSFDPTPVFDAFVEVLGVDKLPWIRNKTQRMAAENLLKRFKITKITSALRYVKEHEDDPRMYTILTPWELDNKWAHLLKHKEKNGG